MAQPGDLGRVTAAGPARRGIVVTDLPVRHGFVAACAHLEGEGVTCREFDWTGRGRG